MNGERRLLPRGKRQIRVANFTQIANRRRVNPFIPRFSSAFSSAIRQRSPRERIIAALARARESCLARASGEINRAIERDNHRTFSIEF